MTYNSARDTYFETQVLTATPQKLRWMAIDGAIRYLKQADEHWRNERYYEGGEAVVGCQRIVVELITGLKPELAPELVSQVASLYAYLTRVLFEAQRDRDLKKLADAMAVLEIERETWRLVGEQLGNGPSAVPSPHVASRADLPSAQAAPVRSLGGPTFQSLDFNAGASGFTASA